ncbi:MAG: PAS domain-containing protein [Synergistaceae bacterium]
MSENSKDSINHNKSIQELELYRNSRLSGVFIIAVDQDLTLIYANDNFYNIIEYTKETMEEHLNNHSLKLIHPDDTPMVKETISDALQTGKDYIE